MSQIYSEEVELFQLDSNTIYKQIRDKRERRNDSKMYFISETFLIEGSMRRTIKIGGSQ